jgi:hypothetical protein
MFKTSCVLVCAHINTQDVLNIYTQLLKLFNCNFSYKHTTQCFDCGECIYKQLHLVLLGPGIP